AGPGAGLEHDRLAALAPQQRGRRKAGRARADDDLVAVHARVIASRRTRATVGRVDHRMETSRDDGPTPQPERHEPQLEDVRLRDLSFADWRAILVRAGKEFMSDNAMMLASA